MTDANDHKPEDLELQRTLRRWEMDGAPEALRRRVMASHDELRPHSPWARLWRMRISMPAPIAAVVLILLVATGALAARVAARHERPASHVTTPSQGSGGLANLKPLREIRVAVIKKADADARP